MAYRILAVLFLAGLAAAQQNFGGPSAGFIPCGFVCTRNAAFTTNIDGVSTRATCTTSTSGALSDRCNGCCQSYALWGGLSTTSAAGFPASDGRTCVCCVNNNMCRGK